MTKLRYLKVVAVCILVVGNGLTACQGITPVPESTPIYITRSVPVSTATEEVMDIHPELEAITPYNVGRLRQIDQWGKGVVNGIALSPDGGLIAVSTSTGIYLYDRKTVKQISYIDIRIGSNNNVEIQGCPTSGNLAFSPDGSILAIANTDIALWDLKTNTPRAVIKNKIEDPDSIITEIHFSVDGNRILGIQRQASGYPCYSGWGSLVMYSIEEGELIFRQDYHRYEEGPTPLFTEKDDRAFISYYNAQKEGYSLLEVELQTGNVVGESQSPAISSMNGNVAVTYSRINTGGIGDGSSQAHIVALTSFKDIETLNAGVELIPHSNKMMVYEKQKLTIRTFDGIVICTKSIDVESAHAFHPDLFSLDGSIAVSWNSYGDRAGDIRIWDLEQCTISNPVLIFPEVARQLSISSDGRSVLTDSNAGYTFHVFDIQTGQMRFSLSGYDAQFSANGQQVFVVEPETINAYNVETGEYLFSVAAIDSDYMTEIIVSPDGKFLVVNDTSTRDYRIVDIGDTSLMDRALTFGNSTPCFSRNEKLMATIKDKLGVSELHFWELASGNELTEWQASIPSEGYANKKSFNSNFTQLATFGTDGYYKYVYIWDIPGFSLANVLTQPFPNTNRPIRNLEFISNDSLLFARGINPDGFLFWDVQTGDLLAEIPAEIHESELGNPVAFSPDGKLLLVLDNDRTIHIWGIK